MNRVVRGWTLALSACALAACEIGTDESGNGGAGQQTTVTLTSTPGLDGWVRTDGNFAFSGTPITGDLDVAAPGQGYRQFYSFDIGADLPPGTTISSATLRLYQAGVGGTPYTDLGAVLVDHLDYGESLEGTDYALAALGTNIGTISNSAAEGYKELTVTARVQADIAAARTRSQFRVRFATDGNNDGNSDYAQFTDGEVTVNRPQLVVRY